MPASRPDAGSSRPGFESTARSRGVTDEHCRNLDHAAGAPGEECRIQTEVVVYYFDAEWGNASGECLGIPRWLPIYDSPTPLKAGQRIAIDGVIVPQRERFVWGKTHIRVLEENVDLKPEKVSDLGHNPQELKDRLVSVEGLIDSTLEDPTHCAIDFLSGSTLARAYVLKGKNGPPLKFKAGISSA